MKTVGTDFLQHCEHGGFIAPLVEGRVVVPEGLQLLQHRRALVHLDEVHECHPVFELERRISQTLRLHRTHLLVHVLERLQVAFHLDRIARLARVARPTVYLVFGSRAGLFEAVGADLLERGGFGRILQAAARPDAREALREGIAAIVEMYAAHRDVVRVLSSMALLDAAAVGGAIQRMEQGRARGMVHLAQRLADQERCLPTSPPTKPPTCCGY